MLQRLRVRGLALLNDVSLELGPGLNVLTGETGAGKSLILLSLAALLGQPGASEVLKSASNELCIEAQFAGAEPAAPPLCVGLALRGSRLRATLGGKALPLGELQRRLAGSLIWTAQGAARELASPASVLALLDARAGTADDARAYRARRSEWLRAGAELGGLQAELSTRAARSERLTGLLEGLAELAPRPGEYAELARRIELLASRQHSLELCARLRDAICEREPSIEGELSQLLGAVRRAPAEAAFRELGESLAEALGTLARVGRQAERLASDLDGDPLELAALERRREALERMAARLGRSPEDLAEAAPDLERERVALETLEERIATLQALRLVKQREALALADAIGRARTRALPRLNRELSSELRGLLLESAELVLTLEALGEPLGHEEPARLGLGFSANAGQPLLPLERIASGGERARFVLALACVGAGAGRTLVFDEIDQGVGGEALTRVAARLGALGRTHQILCVTHQAAIAARAGSHFRVTKSGRGGSVVTTVARLDEEGRTRELSRMLAGDSSAERARALARHLLAEACSAA